MMCCRKTSWNSERVSTEVTLSVCWPQGNLLTCLQPDFLFFFDVVRSWNWFGFCVNSRHLNQSYMHILLFHHIFKCYSLFLSKIYSIFTTLHFLPIPWFWFYFLYCARCHSWLPLKRNWSSSFELHFLPTLLSQGGSGQCKANLAKFRLSLPVIILSYMQNISSLGASVKAQGLSLECVFSILNSINFSSQ